MPINVPVGRYSISGVNEPKIRRSWWIKKNKIKNKVIKKISHAKNHFSSVVYQRKNIYSIDRNKRTNLEEREKNNGCARIMQ